MVVSTAGTLDGTGTVSSGITINSGGTLANGDGSLALFNIGSASFTGGAAASVNVSGSSSPTTAGVNVTGQLATDSNGSGLISLNVSAPATSLIPGTYDLIKYGSFVGTSADFKVGTVIGMSTRQSATVVNDVSNSALAINVVGNAGNLLWRGSNSNNWSTGSTGNWLNNAAADDFYNGDLVTFDDSVGGGPTVINVDSSGVIVGAVAFNNSSAVPYTLMGGTLNGAGGALMSINGGGNVALNTTYSGNVNISSGTLRIGNGGTIGGLAASSSINNNGSLVFNRSNTLVQGTDLGTIAGSGSVTQQGVGTLTLTAANTYTGVTNIAGGVLQLGNGGTTGSLSGSSGIIDNGQLVFNRSNVITQGSDFGAAAISGSGSVIQSGNGTTILSTANTYSGGTTVNAGTLVAGNNSAFGSGMLNLNGGGLGSSTAITLTNNVGVTGSNVIGWSSQSTNISLNGTLTGGGTLSNFVGSAVSYNIYLLGDLSGFTGVLNYTCDSAAATGWWRVGASNTTTDLSNAALNISIGTVTNTASACKNFGFTDGISNAVLKLGSLSGNGIFQASFNNAGPNSLQVGYLNTSTTFNGIIAGAGAGTKLSLTKVGTGTLSLGGSNAYTGGTNINGGTLQLTTTSGAANSGTFNISGAAFQVNLGSGSNFAYAPTINLLAANSSIGNAAPGLVGSTNGQVNFTGTLNGSGYALNVVNTGLARWYMNGTVSNVSQINVQSGAMGFDLSTGNQGGGAPVNVSSGASLYLANGGSSLANSLTLTGTGISSVGALYEEGGATETVNSNIMLVGNTSIGGDTATGNVTLAGTISGVGKTLTMVGANTYSLTGTDTYTGGTVISSGTIQLGNGGTTGAIPVSGGITDNATFAFDRSNTITQGIDFGTITGVGGTSVQGGGTVIFNAANTYTGTTVINAGTVIVTGAAARLSSALR